MGVHSVRLVFLVVSLTIITGCNSLDPETVWAINKRITELEAGKQISPAKTPSRLGSQWGNYVILYLPVAGDGHFPVKITQTSANVFEGPRGEIYYGMPTVDQLIKAYTSTSK